MIISLTGFMGVGKSTIAEKLSAHLYCKHTDLDKYIENIHNDTVEGIFSKHGEMYFREIEEQALESIINGNKEKVLVLSLGGGALISEKNRELIKNRTMCIYLRAGTETLYQRLIKSRKSRPLVEKEDDTELRNKIVNLWNIREEGYVQSASVTIDVDNLSVKEILIKILSLI